MSTFLCFHRKCSEEQPDGFGGVPYGRAAAVHGVVPCRGSHLDQRVYPRVPADDRRRGRRHVLLHQVRNQGSVFASQVESLLTVFFYCRDKSQLPLTPIVSSVLTLMRYHLGTVAKGAFIITLVEIPRLILSYIHTQLKGKVSPMLNLDFYSFCRQEWSVYTSCFLQENACARCMLKACICCLWCLEKCLNYLNVVSDFLHIFD